MKTLVLNEAESLKLQRDGAVEVTRNGFDILVEYDGDYRFNYIITVVNPFNNVVVNLDMKKKTEAILSRKMEELK